MKNKNVLIAFVVVLLLLLLGAGAYLMLSKNATKSAQVPTEKTQKTNTQAEQTTKSLLDLVNSGQKLRCTYKTAIANGTSDGTVYISGQNIRADFNATVQGQKPTQTSMIKNRTTTYIWGSIMQGKGIKMTTSLDAMAQSKEAAQYVDPTQKLDYSCAPWNVDSSLFTAPSNVEFTDMTNLMVPKATVTGTQTQTAPSSSDPCAQLTGSVKTACENALQQSGK